MTAHVSRRAPTSRVNEVAVLHRVRVRRVRHADDGVRFPVMLGHEWNERS
jgi:hypothetical protein